MIYRRVLFFAVLSILAGGPAAWAQPAGKGVRKDHVGDPLPDGAKLRIGTTRLHHLGMVGQLYFLSDGKQLASLGEDRVVSLWNLSDGKEVRRIALPGHSHSGEIPLAFERMGLQLELRRYFNTDTIIPSSAVFAADGKSVAVVQGENVRVLDTVNGKQIAQITFKDAKPAVLALAAGGKILARFSMNEDREAELSVIDIASSKQIHKLRLGGRHNRAQLAALHFSPDGKYLAGVVNQIQIALWDLNLGKRIRLYEGHEGPITSIVFAPGGKKLASAAVDGIRIWDHASDEEVVKIATPDLDYGTAVAFSPDGTTLAATGKENTIALWDLATLTQRKQLLGHDALVSAFAFSADGKRLASGSIDGAIRLWDVGTTKEITPFQHSPRFNPLGYVKPGVILAQVDHNPATLHHVEEATGKIQRSFNGPAEPNLGAVPSPDGKYLAIADQENALVRLWDMRANKEWKKLEGHAAGRILQMAFSGDSAWCASVGSDKTLRVWNTATGKEVRSIELPFSLDDRVQIIMRGAGFVQQRSVIGTELQDLLFSADNRTLIWLGPDGSAYVWEIASGKERVRLPLGNRAASFLTVSPDSRLIAAAANDDTLRVWNASDGKLLHGFVSPEGEVRAVAFAPNSKLLAVGTVNGVIFLYDLAAGKEKRRFSGHHGSVQKLIFADRGTTLLSSARDGTMLVWDVHAPAAATPPTDEPEKARLTELWAKLAGEATEAHDAAGELAKHPLVAVRFLQAQLKPAALLPRARVEQLVGELDHPKFTVREKAANELTKLGDSVVPALQKVLDGKPSVEKSRRINQIVEKLTEKQGDAVHLRLLRAVELLERIDTPDAHALLQILAGGAADAQLTSAAKDALGRVQRVP